MNDYLMSPKNDFVFKLIFGDEKNKHILIAFLTNVLNMQEGEIADIKLINSELLREFKEDKKGILDVRAKIKDGEQINIEIQILPTEFMPERTLFYWSKMFVSQIKSGETYDQLKRCITINIVDFECTPLKQLHSCYHLIEDKTGHRLTDIQEVHFMELPKLFDPAVVIDENDSVAQWMMFINAKSREVIEMLAQKNKHIGNAFDLLQIIAHDEKARMLYEARQAEIMDQLTRIKSAQKAILKAKAQGIKEGEGKIVKAMLSRGMSIEEVASIANMDISKVIEIKNDLV